MAPRPTILFVTDLAYPARGRRYADEDISLTSRLREDFCLALCHPRDVPALMDDFDAVVIRNSGPVHSYRLEYELMRAHATQRRTRMFPSLTGKADMLGKQYLVELTLAGYPVIPTVARREDLSRLPQAERYVVKPRLGADSIGLQSVPAGGLEGVAFDDVVVQPRVAFDYEVSFYFVDRTYQYALYGPDPGARWELERYDPSPADLDFAQRFVDWNDVDHGIQRVDACRTSDGDLLLVELEDLNPYLSLDALDDKTRVALIDAMRASLLSLLFVAG